MTNDPRFGYDAIRQRARRYARQIAVAVALTVMAAGFLIAALASSQSPFGVNAHRISTVAR